MPGLQSPVSNPMVAMIRQKALNALFPDPGKQRVSAGFRTATGKRQLNRCREIRNGVSSRTYIYDRVLPLRIVPPYAVCIRLNAARHTSSSQLHGTTVA